MAGQSSSQFDQFASGMNNQTAFTASQSRWGVSGKRSTARAILWPGHILFVLLSPPRKLDLFHPPMELIFISDGFSVSAMIMCMYRCLPFVFDVQRTRSSLTNDDTCKTHTSSRDFPFQRLANLYVHVQVAKQTPDPLRLDYSCAWPVPLASRRRLGTETMHTSR